MLQKKDKHFFHVIIVETYWEPSDTIKIELLAKIVLKSSISDVWMGSEYASVLSYLFT